MAFEIAKNYDHLIDLKDGDGLTALQLLACNPAAFHFRGEGWLMALIDSRKFGLFAHCSNFSGKDRYTFLSENYQTLILRFQVLKPMVMTVLVTCMKVNYKNSEI